MLKITFKSLSVFIFTFTFLSAQTDLQYQKNYADSLFNSGKLFEAITEYKRLLFFDENNIHKFEALNKIAQCYKGGSKHDDAISTLAKLKTGETDSIKLYGIETEIIRLNILRGTTARALFLIEKLEKDYPEKQAELSYWKGWSYMISDDWENASEAFSQADSGKILKTLCDSVAAEKYSLSFARTISYILPGSGHFYTGHFVEGVISLGWNVLWGYSTINAFYSDRVFDGIMVGDLLWLRFYAGGIQEAEKLAGYENQVIASKAYKFLDEKYEGIKP